MTKRLSLTQSLRVPLKRYSRIASAYGMPPFPGDAYRRLRRMVSALDRLRTRVEETILSGLPSDSVRVSVRMDYPIPGVRRRSTAIWLRRGRAQEMDAESFQLLFRFCLLRNAWLNFSRTSGKNNGFIHDPQRLALCFSGGHRDISGPRWETNAQ